MKMSAYKALFTVYLVIIFITFTVLTERIRFPDEHEALDNRRYFYSFEDYIKCTTNEFTTGYCRRPKDCKLFRSLLKHNFKPKICQWNYEQPLICCPINKNFLNRIKVNSFKKENKSKMEVTTERSAMSTTTAKMIAEIDSMLSYFKPDSIEQRSNVTNEPSSNKSIIKDNLLTTPPSKVTENLEHELKSSTATTITPVTSSSDSSSTTVASVSLSSPSSITNRDGNKVVNLRNCGTRIVQHSFVPRARVITSNEPSMKGEWPWMVVILKINKRRNETVYVCGGSIISDRFIVTAAHCFNQPNYFLDDYIIRVGDIRENTGYTYDIHHVIKNPLWQVFLRYNDIALLRTVDVIKFNDHVRPICLPEFNQTLPSQAPVIVTGFGDTEFGGRRSERLLAANLRIKSMDVCNRSYSMLNTYSITQGITNALICAGSEDGTMDSCQNDSGGPLNYFDEEKNQWFLVGIVSFGHKCADPRFPGVYTRVASYVRWLRSIIELHKSKSPPNIT